MTSEPKETITVDANPFAVGTSRGKARAVLFSGKFIFITAEYTIWEVKKYIPELSNQSGVPASDLLFTFDHFPILSVPSVVYDEKRQQAANLIAHRDPKDVDILALALKFNTPLWTNDRDFQTLSELKIFTTADILEKLAALTV